MRRLTLPLLVAFSLFLPASALAHSHSAAPAFSRHHVCSKFHNLIPLYEQAQTKFNVPWTAVAAINFLYDDFGCRKVAATAPFLPMSPDQLSIYGISGNGSAIVTLQDPADAVDSVMFLLSQNGGQTSLAPAFRYYYRSAHKAGLALAVNKEIAEECGYEGRHVNKGPMLLGMSSEGILNPPKAPVDKRC